MMSDSLCVVTRRNPSANQFCYLCVATELSTIELSKLDTDQDCIESKTLIDAELSSGTLTLKAGGVALILGKAEYLENDFQKQVSSCIRRSSNNDDVNRLAEFLFSCENEEKFRTGRDMYDLPKFGKLKFSGLHGVVPILKSIQQNDDLGHPLCENVRNGNWLISYLTAKFDGNFDKEMNVRSCLKPLQFTKIIATLYNEITRLIHNKLRTTQKPLLFELLALGSTALMGKVDNLDLAPYKEETFENSTFAAGVPHFAEGVWRMWGRDVFISLPGSLLKLNRLKEARALILSFAAKLKNGLIPNLYYGDARYNARDASWFWLNSVKEYSKYEPSILKEVQDVINSIIESHIVGIDFTEDAEDHNMQEQGFKISAKIDENGFVTGGNEFNCGTWMDKMGRGGCPATPRDGAAIELTCLLYSALDIWDDSRATELKKRIRENFRKFYAKEFYFNDCLGNSNRCENRPNQFIGMAVARELFIKGDTCSVLSDGEKAIETALSERMLGKLGMSTLSPSDSHYDPYYDGGDNYHDGPEFEGHQKQ